MIEVGHPFSRPFQGLVDSLVNSLQFGVEQPATQELLFHTGTFAYPLRDAGAVSGLAKQITGFVAKKPATFTRDVHSVSMPVSEMLTILASALCGLSLTPVIAGTSEAWSLVELT